MTVLLQEAHGLRGREGQPGPREGCVVLAVLFPEPGGEVVDGSFIISVEITVL